MVADHIAKRLASKIPAIVTPVVPVGFAAYHGDFAGTLSVPQTVLTEYVYQLCSHLMRHGITHILLVNGHGGNINALQEVVQRF